MLLCESYVAESILGQGPKHKRAGGQTDSLAGHPSKVCDQLAQMLHAIANEGAGQGTETLRWLMTVTCWQWVGPSDLYGKE